MNVETRRTVVAFVALISLFIAAFSAVPLVAYAATEYMVVYAPGEASGNTEIEYYLEGEEATLHSPEDLNFECIAGMEFDYWSIRKDSGMGEEIARKQPGEKITVTQEIYIIAMWKESLGPEPDPGVEGFLVSIGDVMITELNYTDVFGNGKVSFDPETYTLTLNGFHYSGYGAFAMGSAVGIRSKSDLTIELVGENSLNIQQNPEADMEVSTVGILLMNGNLTLCGSGSLDINVNNVGIMGGNFGIVEINGPRITIDAHSTNSAMPACAIAAHTGFRLKNGNLKINSSHNGIYIFLDDGESKISGGRLEMSVGNAGGLFVSVDQENDGYLILPLLPIYEEASVMASSDLTGAGAVEYSVEDHATYQYLSVKSEFFHQHIYGNVPNGKNESAHWHYCTDPACPDVMGSIKDFVPHSAVGTHICICGEVTSECKDENTDHKCDICQKVLGECNDANFDSKCDICNHEMPSNTPDPDPDPDPVPDPAPSDDKNGLGVGAIVGIVLGSVAVAIVGVYAGIWFGFGKKTFADLVAVFKNKNFGELIAPVKDFASVLAKKSKK